MRPTNSNTNGYVWYDSTFPNGVFTMHACDDTKSCIFCHQPAPSSIYYPPLDLLHFAPKDIPRMRARVCNNHYNAYRRFSKNTTFPIPFDELYSKMMKKMGLKGMDTSALPKWTKSLFTDSYEWRGANVPSEYYERFKDWVHSEAILFKGFELRYPLMQRFTFANSDIPAQHLTTFERYLLQPDYQEGEAHNPKLGTTMFD